MALAETRGNAAMAFSPDAKADSKDGGGGGGGGGAESKGGGGAKDAGPSEEK
jgi:hypothetical protein